jgi:hypothetical protein
MTRKLPWFEIALSVVILSVYIYAALSDAYNMPNRWFIRDDAYYYFKVAQNISEGHGSTFDGIHLTNGYHPLWMLVCIPIFALARYDLILPLRVLVIVTGLLQAGTAILLYRLIRTTVSTPVAVLAAIYWSFNSYILVFLYRTGVESSLAIFAILLLLVLTLKLERSWRHAKAGSGQIAVLAIVALAVVFSRLDLVFFALIMGLWIILRGSPLRYLLPLDLLAIFVSTLGAFIARLGLPGYYELSSAAIVMTIVAPIIKLPLLYVLGLYTAPSSWKPLPAMVRLGGAVLLGSLALSVVLLAGAALHLLPSVPRVTLLYDLGFTFGLLFLIRVAAYLFRSKREPQAARGPLDELRASWRQWLAEGAIFYGIVGGSLSLYMIWNRLVFGSFSPVSGEVKRWWGTFLISVYGGPAKSLLSFFTLDSNSEFNAWEPASSLVRKFSNMLLRRAGVDLGSQSWAQYFIVILVIVLVLIMAILLCTRRRATRSVIQTAAIPLFVGSWFQALSYNATGYASLKEWYWLLEPVLVIIVAAVILDVAIQLVLKRWLVTRLMMWALIAGLGLRAGVSYWRDASELYPYGKAPANAPFADVVPFIEAHTTPGSIIGMTGGGNVGYFIHDRTIVNMDGLINSTEYFGDLKAGTASTYLYQSGMRYVFANPDLLSANPYRGQYEGRLAGLQSWGGKDLMKLLPGPSE